MKSYNSFIYLIFTVFFGFHIADVYSANSFTDEADSINRRQNFYKTDSIFSFKSQKGYFPSLAHNMGAQIKAPFHFSKKEWLVTGAVLGVTTSLVFLDDEIDSWATLQKANHPGLAKASPVFTEFGNWNGVALVGAIGTVSAVFGKQKGVQTSLLATQAMITSGVWIHVIKTLTGRERPKGAYLYSQNPTGKWYGPFSRFNKNIASDKSVFAFDAFPSGHTALAFSVATVFADRYKNVKAVPIFCYTTASLIGVSRLIEHEHWASDVFAGAILGYVCGKQVTKRFDETHKKLNNNSKAQFTLIQYENQAGFRVVF
jgi:membrane-associated phospholipid phosphatase